MHSTASEMERGIHRRLPLPPIRPGMPDIGVNVFAERERLLAALRGGEELPELIRRMLAGSLLCALVYGLVLGAQIGGWQIVSSPIKLPLILVGTGVLCVAALYVLLGVSGVRFDWLQVIGLGLCSITASGLVMLSLLPIAAFWTHCFHGDRAAIALVHSGAFVLSGAIGTRFGLEIAALVLPGRRAMLAMVGWMWVYGLVAQQMAWLFRPHFNPTEVFMRPLNSGGSALESIARILIGRL